MIADRALVIEHGAIALSGTAEALKGNPRVAGHLPRHQRR
jgi:ABC-type branched-subunit amino acid transport system ATPase component